jgi:hypothetical protein
MEMEKLEMEKIQIIPKRVVVKRPVVKKKQTKEMRTEEKEIPQQMIKEMQQKFQIIVYTLLTNLTDKINLVNDRIAYKDIDNYLMDNDELLIEYMDLLKSDSTRTLYKRNKAIEDIIEHGVESYELENSNFHTLQEKCRRH